MRVGLCDRIVGRYSSDYPEEIKEVEKITNFDMSINWKRFSLKQFCSDCGIDIMDQIRSIEHLGYRLLPAESESIDVYRLTLKKWGKCRSSRKRK